MFRFFRRLFGWTTLLSLLIWSGVAFYIVWVQPHQRPAPDFYAAYQDCRDKYALGSPYAEIRTATILQCRDYYALIGDRDVPWWHRLRARTAGRIVDEVVSTYLREFPPQPGERVEGPAMLERLGTARVLTFALNTITQANAPTPDAHIRRAACLLRQTRAARSQEELAMIPVRCAN